MNNASDNRQQTGDANGEYRPSLAIYHPNAKGTGGALKMTLNPAHGDVDGCIMLKMANQKTVAETHSGIKRFPTFDWEGRVCVKLGFPDLCKMLQVFRGECESIDDGKGLYHRTKEFSTRIVLRHLIEPIRGYSLEIYRNANGASDSDRSVRMILNESEAMGVSIAFESSIGVICFGVPSACERESSSSAGWSNEVAVA